MKAIIPVAGVGTNLRPLTYTQPKPLIPVAGKPIISFIIDQLQSIGVQDFVFVIGYLGEKIKHYITETYPDIQSTFVHQEKRLGTGHAIWTAREALKDSEELIIFFGDTIVELDMEAMKQATVSCLATHPVDDPREFGVVELDDDGNIIKLVEKPRIPKSNLGMVGFYKIKEVNIYTDASFKNRSKLKAEKILTFNGFNFYNYVKLKYRPNSITNALQIAKGKLYSDLDKGSGGGTAGSGGNYQQLINQVSLNFVFQLCLK